MLSHIKRAQLDVSSKYARRQEKGRRKGQETLNQSATQLSLNGKDFPSLLSASLEDLSSALQSKLFTSLDLVDAYLARIKEVNSIVHGVTEINPDARKIALQLDQERIAGKNRGPLHGIPILLKNIIATDDQMNNSGGSYALLGAKVPRDATVATKLREAGAIILGKANLSQWANYRSSNSSSGWCAHGGQVYGSHHPNQDPGGSSSGSGVCPSLGLCLAAIGTETNGSIVSPSSSNNVVGIKPTVGLISRYLCIPVSEHQDTPGPMAKYVKDAAYVLQAIAGTDDRDKSTLEIPNGGKLPDYVAACDANALAGARIGVAYDVIEARKDEWKSNTQLVEHFASAIQVLRDAGATLVDTEFPALKEIQESEDEITVLDADVGPGLAAYFAELTHNPFNIKSLSELREWTQKFLAEEYSSRDTSRWDHALEHGPLHSDERFKKAYERQMYFGNEGGLVGALDKHNLDAIVLPARMAPKWAAGIGAPIVTVPMGFYSSKQKLELNHRGNLIDSGPGTPFGLAFLGRKWSEEKLIGLAYAYESLTHWRDARLPWVYPTIELKHIVSS